MKAKYPQFIRQRLDPRWQSTAPAQCECGQLATHIGKMGLLSPHGWPLEGAMFLCPECAQQVDAGVTVEAIPERQVTA